MDSTVAELKKIPLQAIHERLGAKMVPFAGYLMPVRYSSDLEEHHAVRQAVGVFDVSHMGEFVLRGDYALDLIQRVTSNDASKLEIGKAQYSCLPNEQGGIVDDLLVYRLGEKEYLLVVNASNIDKDWAWISRFNTHKVEMINRSEELCLFAVQGPKAMTVVQKLTAVAIKEIPYYAFAIGNVAGIDNVLISHTGYTGAGGFELYVENAQAEKLWNALFEVGASEQIKPIGLGARDTLRLEMGYCLYGNDIDDNTSPLEAGLGWITKFTKAFTNSENLKKQKEAGVTRKLVGIELIEKGIARGHYEIWNERQEVIGHVTSGTQSPTLGKAVAMGYVQSEFATPGMEIYINIRQKACKARVVKMPFVTGNV